MSTESNKPELKILKHSQLNTGTFASQGCGMGINISSTTEKPKIKVTANWLKIQQEMTANLTSKGLHTICAEGACPNIVECWSKKHAAFMILGDVCTRRCTFCYVKKGRPTTIDLQEPSNLAQTAFDMGLKHIVITSVTRDDLKDGGASHFVNCIKEIRTLYSNNNKSITIEVLTPDFKRKSGALEAIIAAKPDVLNHNIETMPRLYSTVRIGSSYTYSLDFLRSIKQIDPMIFTKSGFMLGLGETEDEIVQTLQDLRNADVDFVTIGQYLRPTTYHHEVKKAITDEEFARYKQIALDMGFLMVASSKLTRSSYHADEDFEILKQNRQQLHTTISI